MKCSRCTANRPANRTVCLRCHRRLEVYRARYNRKLRLEAAFEMPAEPGLSAMVAETYTLAQWDQSLRQLVAELRRP